MTKTGQKNISPESTSINDTAVNKYEHIVQYGAADIEAIVVVDPADHAGEPIAQKGSCMWHCAVMVLVVLTGAVVVFLLRGDGQMRIHMCPALA